MRVNVMFGLNHLAHDRTAQEAAQETARLLHELADILVGDDRLLQIGDTVVLSDQCGTRIGVLDVFKD